METLTMRFNLTALIIDMLTLTTLFLIYGVPFAYILYQFRFIAINFAGFIFIYLVFTILTVTTIKQVAHIVHETITTHLNHRYRNQQQ